MDLELRSRKPNKGVNPASKYKGISFHNSKLLWFARFTAGGQTINLGYFEKEEDAAKAYTEFKRSFEKNPVKAVSEKTTRWKLVEIKK